MKFYVVAGFILRDEVKKLNRVIREHGHEIVHDWTEHEKLEHTFNRVSSLAKEYALLDVDGVRDSEVFVLLSGKYGVGHHTELGVAISSYLDHGKPEIYVIGNHWEESMFFFHPAVKRRKTIEEVLADFD